MNVYETQQLRNLALTGHAGSGKTSLAEAILLKAGAINRKGTVEDKNTVSDFHELEHERTCSVFSTLMAIEYKGIKINLVDTPGYDDFIGETIASIRASDVSALIVNAHSGIEVGTEIGWIQSEKMEKPLIMIINKLDQENVDFDKVVDELKSQFSQHVLLMQYPISTGQGANQLVDLLKMKLLKFNADGEYEEADIPSGESEKAEGLRNELIESVAESDDELMNKYFEAGELTDDDFRVGLKNAIVNRSLFPLFCSVSKTNTGANTLLEFINNYLPSPVDMPAELTENEKEVRFDVTKPASLFTFKMFSDSRLGDMTYFRVYTGKVASGKDLIVASNNNPERLGQVFVINGKNRTEVPELVAGDIGAVVKLKNTHINDTLHEKGFDVSYKKIEYTNPKVRIAIEPKTKGEEEKVGLALHHLHLEDPSLGVVHSQELKQLIVYTQGEQHLSVAKWRLENRYKVEVVFKEPRVPYRETIQKQIRGSYRHKKQSGGAGQFAEVHMVIEPYSEGAPYPDGLSIRGKDLTDLDWGGQLEYVNCIVGGVIEQRFMPAILKGVMEKMEVGPLTGSYVRDIRVLIVDGKMHPVDSNEAAFKMAGSRVFSDNFRQASPKLLEPVYDVKIRVPEEFVGDVMSDLPSRRGVILGIDVDGRYQVVNAKMPLAELDRYATALRSMTQARATYNSEFAEYQTVPANIQQELMDSYRKEQEEEE